MDQNDLNLKIIDNLEDNLDIDKVMMQCNRVELMDFFPPHFVPDVANCDDILEYEKIIEKKCAVFEYDGGIVLILDNDKIYDYINKIYTKLYESKEGIKFRGTEREIFTINYSDVAGNPHYTKNKLEFLKDDPKNRRKIVRFSFIRMD